MNKLEEKIFTTFKSKGQYNYSANMSEKKLEIKAIEHLKNSGYIKVRANALGFCIADVL